MSNHDHEKVARFYDKVYYRNVSETRGAISPHLRRLAKRLRVIPGMMVLDVACGTGQWLAAAAERGAKVAGIDISEKAIEACRQRLPSGRFIGGIAEELPFADGVFDLVTCLGSLEHFLDQPGALREMRRVGKVGGCAVILVPNAGFPLYRFGLYGGTHQQAIHETVRPLDEWAGLFQEAGFSVEKRWRDLHVLSRNWILRPPWFMPPLRLAQALALTVWPISWQYQVYHLCRIP